MRKMTCLALALAGLAALPARASEVGLLIDKQIGQSVDLPGTPGKFNSVSPTGFGIRGAYTLLDLKVAELGIAATYHPKAEEDLKLEYPGGEVRLGKLGSEYIAIGAQVDWKFLVNVHAGLDLRREKISNGSLDSEGLVSFHVDGGDTTITRPWIKAGVGFSIPLPLVSPFVRLEAAYALKDYSVNENSGDNDFRKAMAPKYQVALYGGIRF